MRKIVTLAAGLSVLLIGFSGCDNKVITESTTAQNTPLAPKALAQSPAQADTPKEVSEASEESQIPEGTKVSMDDVADVFRDSARITPAGKYQILVFASGKDPYTNQLKKDIKLNEALNSRLKNDFSVYYLDLDHDRTHALEHNGNFMNASTHMFAEIYGINATPSLVFCDKTGKRIFIVPGYMPADQFLVTLDFIEQKKWGDKDRKDGSVYEALKTFYTEKGVLKQ